MTHLTVQQADATGNTARWLEHVSEADYNRGGAGAFTLSSTKDAALFTTLAAGAYTVQLKSVDGKGGDSLIEIYDVDGLN